MGVAHVCLMLVLLVPAEIALFSQMLIPPGCSHNCCYINSPAPS